VVSSDSSRLRGGRIEGIRLASMVLPDPGAPIIIDIGAIFRTALEDALQRREAA